MRRTLHKKRNKQFRTSFILLGLLFVALLPNIAMATEGQFKAWVTKVDKDIVIVEDSEGKTYEVPVNIDLGNVNQLNIGDKVLVEALQIIDGETEYVIVDFIRDFSVYAVLIIFIIVVLVINGKKGIRSIINLVITLSIILFFIIPFILKGWNPVLITIIGSVFIMLWNIYYTYGINKKSHSALCGITLSLIITGLFALFSIKLTSLTGFAADEATYLAVIGDFTIDMRGLLLAAFIIGALGVLDDVAVNQASVVDELTRTNTRIKKSELLQSALRVGKDHTSAVINTLVLAYVGAAFPLVILFTLNEPPFDTMSGIFNNEIVATEIIRTLVGSIGIVLTMPITTWVAMLFFASKKVV